MNRGSSRTATGFRCSGARGASCGTAKARGAGRGGPQVPGGSRMTTQPLLTTTVGSFPKPPSLLEARRKHARKQLGAEELRALERRATEDWIRRQEEIGLDILVDGEMYRGDMVAYFADQMDGFAIPGLVRSYGNRYYPKPAVVRPVGRRAPITVEWWSYAQRLTPRPVKGMLTGPYTIAEWSFNEHYPTRRELVLELDRKSVV